jgi:hypothetical protein
MEKLEEMGNAQRRMGEGGQSRDGYEVYGMQKAKFVLKGALWRWVWQLWGFQRRQKRVWSSVVQVRVSAVSQKPLLTGRQAGRADPPLFTFGPHINPGFSHRALCMQPGSQDLQRGGGMRHSQPCLVWEGEQEDQQRFGPLRERGERDDPAIQAIQRSNAVLVPVVLRVAQSCRSRFPRLLPLPAVEPVATAPALVGASETGRSRTMTRRLSLLSLMTVN